MKILLAITVILTPLFCFTQSIDSIVIAAIDGIGHTDTVKFGFKDDASVGIDSLFGEKNLYGEPNQDLDLRFIHRTETQIEHGIDTFWLSGCSSTGNVKPFPENLDMKNDFRAPNPFFDNQFVLKVNGSNFPITVKLVGYYGGLYDIPFCIHDSLTITPSNMDNGDIDTIVHIEDSQQLCLINFRPWVILSSKKDYRTGFRLFPNPSNRTINLRHSGYNLLNEVININGTKLGRFISFGDNYEFNISEYPPGIYFIRNKFGSYKFIKN